MDRQSVRLKAKSGREFSGEFEDTGITVAVFVFKKSIEAQMIELTLKEYNAIHTDYRGVWSTERTDWPGLG